ncbi:hypothetical protein R5M92_14125 [Halomonas sp. Bachu 37]|uniref:hypothetical protein n=1 Tax=Halomonas kashgarensis TaxID=3084920 RepID=UPI003216AE9D
MGREEAFIPAVLADLPNGGANMLSTEALKKLGILGVSFGLIASPLAFANQDEYNDADTRQQQTVNQDRNPNADTDQHADMNTGTTAGSVGGNANIEERDEDEDTRQQQTINRDRNPNAETDQQAEVPMPGTTTDGTAGTAGTTGTAGAAGSTNLEEVDEEEDTRQQQTINRDRNPNAETDQQAETGTSQND